MSQISRLLSAVAVLLGTCLTARAQLPCNLTVPPCASVACRGGCGGSLVASHSGDVCVTGGSFTLVGTRYEDTCDGSILLSCAQAGVLPPVRLWTAGAYRAANSGCADQAAEDWLANAGVDLGLPNGRGRWILNNADFGDRAVDGCPSDATGATHLVAEISDVDAVAEGTVGHRSWYLAAAVPRNGATYDFDRVTGAPGCNPADVPAAPVPGLTILRTEQPVFPTCVIGPECPNSFGQVVSVRLDEPNPAWYTDAGRNGAPPLIAGYQIVYADGASLADEPRTSLAAAGGWRPVLDPAAPRLAPRALGVIPVGTTAPVDVFIPYAPGRYAWLATRLVYADPELSPTGPFDPASASGPLLVTPVSAHQGPIDLGLHGDCDGCSCTSTDDGIPAGQAIPTGSPLSLLIDVSNPSGQLDGGTAAVETRLPACIDTAGFDPAASPAQVQVTPGPASVTWIGASRLLRVDFASFPPLSRHTILITGLRAGAPTPDCCFQVATTFSAFPVTTLAWDAELGCGPTCFPITAIPGCPVPPGAVTDLRVTRRGLDVDLLWDESLEAVTDHYNVWKVVNGDRTLIPVANATTAAVDPNVQSVCRDRPRAAPSCTDATAVAPPPALLYYQVRAACADGTEGTSQ